MKKTDCTTTDLLIKLFTAKSKISQINTMSDNKITTTLFAVKSANLFIILQISVRTILQIYIAVRSLEC